MQHHNITIIQLMSVILSTGSTSKASKKEGRPNVFYHVYKRFFFIFRIQNAFFNVFYFFPNVYYNYGNNVAYRSRVMPQKAIFKGLKIECQRHAGLLTWQSYWTSPAIWDHTVLPGTRNKWTCPAFTPASMLILDLHTLEGCKAELT